MAFADDLLEQAHHLANRERKRPRQASLRRAVSTAYYALFHLLTAAAASNWKHPRQRYDFARIFQHTSMKAASNRVRNAAPQNPPTPTDVNLRKIANAFVELQQHRHIADYDGSRPWSRTEVQKVIDLAAEAFALWKTVKGEAIVQDYLLSLMGKERS